MLLYKGLWQRLQTIWRTWSAVIEILWSLKSLHANLLRCTKLFLTNSVKKRNSGWRNQVLSYHLSHLLCWGNVLREEELVLLDTEFSRMDGFQSVENLRTVQLAFLTSEMHSTYIVGFIFQCHLPQSSLHHQVLYSSGFRRTNEVRTQLLGYLQVNSSIFASWRLPGTYHIAN